MKNNKSIRRVIILLFIISFYMVPVMDFPWRRGHIEIKDRLAGNIKLPQLTYFSLLKVWFGKIDNSKILITDQEHRNVQLKWTFRIRYYEYIATITGLFFVTFILWNLNNLETAVYLKKNDFLKLLALMLAICIFSIINKENFWLHLYLTLLYGFQTLCAAIVIFRIPEKNEVQKKNYYTYNYLVIHVILLSCTVKSIYSFVYWTKHALSIIH